MDLQTHYIDGLVSPGIVRGMEGYDRVAAPHGVEPRHPSADRRIIEFFLRLPLDQKVRHGWNKYLVRKSMVSLIGERAAWRKGREHLGWKQVCVLMDHGHDAVRDIIQNDLNVVEEYLNIDEVNAAWSRYESNRSDDDRETIFRVATLAAWARRIASISQSGRAG
jgi:asparagine synthase (glutamine-hydrolysing)